MSRYNSSKIKESAFIVLMLTPAIIGFLLFYVYVNFKSVLMAFSFEQGGQTLYGLDNFIRFFNEFTLPDTMFKDTIWNTLRTYLSSILIVYPVSLVMSFALLISAITDFIGNVLSSMLSSFIAVVIVFLVSSVS